MFDDLYKKKYKMSLNVIFFITQIIICTDALNPFKYGKETLKKMCMHN